MKQVETPSFKFYLFSDNGKKQSSCSKRSKKNIYKLDPETREQINVLATASTNDFYLLPYALGSTSK